MSKRFDRRFVDKKLAAFKQELKTQALGTPAELEAFTKISTVLAGLPHDVKRSILMKVSGDLTKQGKFVHSQQLDANTGKFRNFTQPAGRAFDPPRSTAERIDPGSGPVDLAKEPHYGGIQTALLANAAEEVSLDKTSDMIVPALLSQRNSDNLQPNFGRDAERVIENAKATEEALQTLDDSHAAALGSRSKFRSQLSRDLPPGERLQLELAFADSQLSSTKATLLSDRVRKALSLADNPSVSDSDYSKLLQNAVSERWANQITVNGEVLKHETIKPHLMNSTPFFKDLTPDERVLVRILLTVRSEIPREGVESLERLLAAARMAIQLNKDIWEHPTWNDLAQRTGSFEVETTLIARLLSALNEADNLNLEEFVACIEMLRIYNKKKDNVCATSYLRAMGNHLKLSENTFYDFMMQWHKSMFARLNVGHKLAAALALTDAPEIPLHSPWVAWSSAIPEGLFANLEPHSNVLGIGNEQSTELGTITLKRAWFLGTELVAILGDNNGPSEGTTTSWGIHMDRIFGEDIVQMVRNLGMGAIAAIQNHPAKQSGSWGASRSKTNTKRLEAPPVGTVYELAHPVTIDLRDDLKRAIAGDRGRKGSSPKAYWIVSGHWKQQVHGPKRGLRKTIWIEPYPKGDPTLKALMRTTDVGENE